MNCLPEDLEQIRGSVSFASWAKLAWWERSQFVAIAVALLIYSKSGGILAQVIGENP
jgi:hypothetical protein